MNNDYLNYPEVISYENNDINTNIDTIAKAYAIRDKVGFNKNINDIILSSSKKLGYDNESIMNSIKFDIINNFKNDINKYFNDTNQEHSLNYDLQVLKDIKLSSAEYAHKIQRFNHFNSFADKSDENIIYDFYSSLTLDELNTLGW